MTRTKKILTMLLLLTMVLGVVPGMNAKAAGGSKEAAKKILLYDLAQGMKSQSASEAVTHIQGILDEYNMDTTITATTSLPATLGINDAQLVMVWLPKDVISASDLSKFSGFLKAGGRILFVGEWNGFAATENANISEAIKSLGGNMAVLETTELESPVSMSVSSQIAYGDGMTPITEFHTGYYAALSVTGTAEAVAVSSSGAIVVADQYVSNGRISLVADMNPFDDTLASKNAAFIRNLFVSSYNNMTAVEAGGSGNGIQIQGTLTLSGTPEVGKTVTATYKGKAGETVSYQWYRATSNTTTGGTKIAGATSSTYKVTGADSKSYLYCVALGSGKYGGLVKPANALGPVTGEEPKEPKEPTQEAPKKGTVFTSGVYTYKITNANTKGKGTVKVTGFAVGKSAVAVKIPSTRTYKGVTYKVTEIGSKAFYKNSKIKSATIGGNVTKISTAAFRQCKNLKTVKVGDKVKTISNKAFYNCPKLQTVTIGSGVTKIGSHVFCHDKKLRKITIKSTKLSSVGEHNLFKTQSVTIKVPAAKVKAYKKLFKNQGKNKKLSITK